MQPECFAQMKLFVCLFAAPSVCLSGYNVRAQFRTLVKC